jgi:hypothetical protein
MINSEVTMMVGFLPLMKGEMKEGVGVFLNLSNHPLNPLLHKEGEHAKHKVMRKIFVELRG